MFGKIAKQYGLEGVEEIARSCAMGNVRDLPHEPWWKLSWLYCYNSVYGRQESGRTSLVGE